MDGFKTMKHYRPACYEDMPDKCAGPGGCPKCMTNGNEQNPTRFRTNTDDTMLLYYYVDFCPAPCVMVQWCVAEEGFRCGDVCVSCARSRMLVR